MADQEFPQTAQPVATEIPAPVQVAPVVPEKPFTRADNHQHAKHGGFGEPVNE